MNIIKSNNKDLISAKELYLELGIKRKFSNWIKQSIEHTLIEVDKDYVTIKMKSTGGRPSVDYLLTIESAMRLIIFCRKTKKGIELYKELSNYIGRDVIQMQRTRKELLFEINIIDALAGITKIIPQYSVLNYKVDFYLPELNIVIEYDEKNHIYYKNDKKRQTDIENYLQCHILRIHEGFELVGLNKIYKIVLYNYLIDLWKNEKLDQKLIGLMEVIGSEMDLIFNY